MLRLDRSFVTPLDREDIHSLATTLDNVVDLMDGTARRAQMLHLADRREPTKQLTAVLARATVLIREAVHKVRQPKDVARISREIKKLEEAGDALYFQRGGRAVRGNAQRARGDQVEGALRQH